MRPDIVRNIKKRRVPQVGPIVACHRSDLVKVPHDLPIDLKRHLFEKNMPCVCGWAWV